MSKKRIQITLDPKIWEEAVKIAYEDKRSTLSAIIQEQLMKFINQQKKKQ